MHGVCTAFAGVAKCTSHRRGAPGYPEALKAALVGRLRITRRVPRGSGIPSMVVPGQLVPSAALRTTLGASTSEDEAFVLLPAELPVYLDPPRIIVDVQGMASTLQVRFIPLQPVASGFGRAPSAICRISGTASVAPSL